MRGAVLYGPRDVRFEERDTPTIIKPTDAIVRMAVTCVCGSDLWDYRGINPVTQPKPMGHEYCGIVEEVGRAVTSIKPGQFVIGSFFASDNTCPSCQAGYQSSCQHAELVGDAQAPLLRVPLADGALVATPDVPSDGMIPSLLALSDVMGTGWFAADAANVKPGKTVAVVGDGAVGLLGVLSAKQMGAERIIAMSRHEARQKLPREFGATDIVTERGDEGVARIKELTDGSGGLPRDGRTARNQDAAAPVRRFAPPEARGDVTRNISADVIAGSDRHMTRRAFTTMTGRSPLITLWARSAIRSPTTPSCSRLSRARSPSGT
jgi:threonine dehydrogenase-like Zn-dependent dehydrogenase